MTAWNIPSEQCVNQRMRFGGALIAAGLVLAATSRTLVAQELPTDTTYDQNNGPRIVNPDPMTTLAAPPDDLVQSIQADAAQRLGIDLATVQIAASPVDWPDASLGCLQRQAAFAQVVTPGFLIVVDVGGNRLNYHTDAGSRFVVCDGQRRPLAVGI